MQPLILCSKYPDFYAPALFVIYSVGPLPLPMKHETRTMNQNQNQNQLREVGSNYYWDHRSEKTNP